MSYSGVSFRNTKGRETEEEPGDGRSIDGFKVMYGRPINGGGEISNLSSLSRGNRRVTSIGKGVKSCVRPKRRKTYGSK